jgi:hypothetical protein
LSTRDDEVKAALEFFRSYGLALDEVEAELFVDSKAKLRTDPKNAEAVAAMAHINTELHFAKEVTILDFIQTPECLPGCKFCKGHNDRANARTLAHLGHFIK